MKTSSILIVTAALVVAGCTTAHHGRGMSGCDMPMGKMHGPGGGHQMMMEGIDPNNDGKITREEFMRHHEAMFDQMKNREGVIDMKDMKTMHPPRCGGMMGQDRMQR